jgi:hypothetical protein
VEHLAVDQRIEIMRRIWMQGLQPTAAWQADAYIRAMLADPLLVHHFKADASPTPDAYIGIRQSTGRQTLGSYLMLSKSGPRVEIALEPDDVPDFKDNSRVTFGQPNTPWKVIVYLTDAEAVSIARLLTYRALAKIQMR